MRGKHYGIDPAKIVRPGSPPRMRGKQLVFDTPSRAMGITPAHAGKTGLRGGSACTRWDHPRACGENTSTFIQLLSMMGSPPRMRGKLVFCRSVPICPGITPAHAGKTQFHCRKERLFRDHPRACGENRSVCPQSNLYSGSPPRMRGKRSGCSGGVSQWGITPAHAGKTLSSGLPRWSQRDHPRACGEKGFQSSPTPKKPGSPPRVRGKPAQDFPRAVSARITPACAGKTFRSSFCVFFR